jgi:hypothetical protein
MLTTSDSEWAGPFLERRLRHAEEKLGATLGRVARRPVFEPIDAAIVRFRQNRVESAAVKIASMQKFRTPFSSIVETIEDLERGN